MAKNISALEKIHAENFVLVHMTGLNQPREEYLRCVAGGVLNYFAETTDNFFVEVSGERAKLVGQSRVTASRRLTECVKILLTTTPEELKWRKF